LFYRKQYGFEYAADEHREFASHSPAKPLEYGRSPRSGRRQSRPGRQKAPLSRSEGGAFCCARGTRTQFEYAADEHREFAKSLPGEALTSMAGAQHRQSITARPSTTKCPAERPAPAR